MTFQLTSSAFREGQTIPEKYTGDGLDVSPPLVWSDPPPGTTALALICEDPDAPRGIWVHWVVFNLPLETLGLEEGVLPAAGTLPNGSKQGRNDFGNLGYGGPAPPKGKPHRYYFRLYASNAPLDLPIGATREQVVRALQGHVLAEAHLMGKYQR